MSVVTALVAGGLLGVRHAVETDHVAAVTTLVERDDDTPALVGVSWGVGHSLPVVALGLAFFLLGVRFPSTLVAAVEGLVGVVLVVLGVRLVAREIVRLRHEHDGSDGEHEHVGVGSLLVGVSHSHHTAHSHTHVHTDEEGTTERHGHAHIHDESGTGHGHPGLVETEHGHDGDETTARQALDRNGVAVGALHGLAGSGALVVALVATAPSLDSAVAFLGGFATLSVATMGAVAAVWGRALDTRGRRVLVGVAGVVSVAVGVGLVGDVVGLF